MSKSLKDWQALALRAANLGFVHTSLKQYERAEQYYQEALALAIKYEYPTRELTVLNYMANSYVKQRRPNKAINVLNQGIEKANEIGKTSALIQIYDLLHQAHSQIGNYELALDYFKKTAILQDSIKNQEVLTKVADFQTKYETEKKEKENLALQKELELEQLKTNRRNIAIVSTILILSLLAFAIYLIGRQRQLKAEQDAMINAQKLKRAQINPHFFFNALNSIQSLVATSNNKRQQLSYISKFAKLMRQTLEQSVHEFVPIDEEITTLESYLSLQQLRFKDRFDYTINYQSEDNENLYILTQIVQPFIENSIEHGFKNIDYKGELTIEFEKVAEDILKIAITDNGKGIGESQKTHQSRSQTIIKERLALFNEKDKYYFTIENQMTENQVSGVKAIIFTPFQIY